MGLLVECDRKPQAASCVAHAFTELHHASVTGPHLCGACEGETTQTHLRGHGLPTPGTLYFPIWVQRHARLALTQQTTKTEMPHEVLAVPQTCRVRVSRRVPRSGVHPLPQRQPKIRAAALHYGRCGPFRRNRRWRESTAAVRNYYRGGLHGRLHRGVKPTTKK